MIRGFARRAIACWLPLALLAGCSGKVTIDDPWVRAAPPAAGMTAGYLTLHNTTSSPVTLTGASCDSYRDVSLHETRVENGTSKMRHLAAVTVPENGSVEFAPGGRHLMLMEPSRKLSAGDRVRLTLHFAGHDDLTVDAAVRINNQ